MTEKGFCSDACSDYYQNQIEKDRHVIRYFLVGLAVGIVVLFAGVFVNERNIIGAGILLMGVTIVAFPLTTPETIELLGYRKARIVGRILGVLTVVVGLWMSV